MKKILLSIVTVVLFTLLLSTASITVHAEGDDDWKSYYEKARAKREQREKEAMEKWLDELEADGNLTQEAIKAAGKHGEGRVPNIKSGKISKSSGSSGTTYSGSSYSGAGKGWVYSCDELHVIGLPEGANGYTLPGWYGDID